MNIHLARRPGRARRTVAAVITTLVSTSLVVLAAPSIARGWDRLLFPDQPRATALGTGTDRVAVWVCQAPSGTYIPDGPAIAAWVNTKVAPWFSSMSNGKFTTIFDYVGTFAITKSGTVSEEMSECRDEGSRRTESPYTNSMAVTTHALHGGIGGPGVASSLNTPPATSSRGFSVGGRIQVDNNDWLVGHELGHTMTWPHYYTGPASEYDSPFDVMSGNKTTCFSCTFVHTTALNRWISGWIPDSEVIEHAGIPATYAIQPQGTAGNKLVMIPTATSGRYLTLETRVRAGGDENLTRAGVLVSAIDTRGSACGSLSCHGTKRRGGPAVGAPGSYDSLLAPGSTLTVDGVTITNTGANGGGFSASVSATTLSPTAPRSLLVTSTSATTARLTWEAPSSSGSAAVMQYLLTDTRTGVQHCATDALTCDATVSVGARYEFSVVAVSSIGPSHSTTASFTAPRPPTTTPSTTTPGTSPGTTPSNTTAPLLASLQPRAVTATAGNRSISLSWGAGAGELGYMVLDSGGSTVCFTAQTTCVIKNLPVWKRHKFELVVLTGGRGTTVGFSTPLAPWRQVAKSRVKLSSVLERWVAPSKWKPVSGCKTKSGFVTISSSRCVLKVIVLGTKRRIELRR